MQQRWLRRRTTTLRAVATRDCPPEHRRRPRHAVRTGRRPGAAALPRGCAGRKRPGVSTPSTQPPAAAARSPHGPTARCRGVARGVPRVPVACRTMRARCRAVLHAVYIYIVAAARAAKSCAARGSTHRCTHSGKPSVAVNGSAVPRLRRRTGAVPSRAIHGWTDYYRRPTPHARGSAACVRAL